jgi:hypothetical protein
MRRPLAIVALALTVAAMLGATTMDDPKPTSAATTDAPAKAPFAIGDLSFLAGTWRGDVGGGGGAFVEEIWSAPRGNNILGSFRWLNDDGTPMMFEILAIVQEPDAIRLRLRHYTADLAAKDGAEKPLTLTLTELTGGRALFRAEKDAGSLDHILYTRSSDTLAIDVVFIQPPADQPDARPRKPLQFRLTRSAS